MKIGMKGLPASRVALFLLVEQFGISRKIESNFRLHKGYFVVSLQ
jgi:hypothetical protein